MNLKRQTVEKYQINRKKKKKKIFFYFFVLKEGRNVQSWFDIPTSQVGAALAYLVKSFLAVELCVCVCAGIREKTRRLNKETPCKQVNIDKTHVPGRYTKRRKRQVDRVCVCVCVFGWS